MGLGLISGDGSVAFDHEEADVLRPSVAAVGDLAGSFSSTPAAARMCPELVQAEHPKESAWLMAERLGINFNP